MPIAVRDLASRKHERRKAKSASSQLVVSTLDHIDGALWLIAGGFVAQALVCLHGGIELVLKCELEKIHRALIADNGKLDYSSLKSILKESFQAHPKGRLMAINDFDLEKTITFSEAIKRSKDLYPSIAGWEKRLYRLRDARNDIAHYGGDLEKDGEYAAIIVSVAFPFLEEFLADSNDINLSAYLGSALTRELEVAKTLYMRLRKTPDAMPAYILKTVSRAVLYRNVDFPKPTDSDGWVIDDGVDELTVGELLKKSLRSGWDGELIGVECKICDSMNAFVGIEEVLEDHYVDQTTTFVPQFLECARCGLQITRFDLHLAEEHFGRLSLKTVDDYLDPK
jgi:hypothetical protein